MTRLVSSNYQNKTDLFLCSCTTFTVTFNGGNTAYCFFFREKMFLSNSVVYENYGERFCSLLDLEEIQMSKDLSHYTLRKVYLSSKTHPDRHGKPRYRIRVSYRICELQVLDLGNENFFIRLIQY